VCACRDFWLAVFGNVEEVTFDELINGFMNVAKLNVADWGTGAAAETEKVDSGAGSARFNTLAARYLARKWKGVVSVEPSSTGTGSGIGTSVVRLNRFVQFIDRKEYGDTTFVEENLLQMLTFRDLFKSKIKFKLLRSLTGLSAY
jgi:hypothetical protein